VTKPRVLVFTEYYLPGFKAGGPIPSVSRIIEMADQCEFRVVTRDRDLGDVEPFRNHKPCTPVTLGNAQVMYLSRKFKEWWWLRQEIKKWRPEAYYINSAHSPFGTLVPLTLMKLRLFPKTQKVIIAPRGEFGEGALSLKSRKKFAFKPLIRWLIPTDVTWHASNEDELHQIMSWWGTKQPASHTFVVAADPAIEPAQYASTGALNETILTFASRIDRKKGLDRANKIIEQIDSDIFFTWSIQGSVSDQKYLLEIKEQLASLPPNVTVSLKDFFVPDSSQNIFAGATAFVFPTLGENFGHVVAEALSVGCPVFLTADTPWTDLIRRGGGQIITTDEHTASQLSTLARMSEDEQFYLRVKIHSAYRHWYLSNREKSNPFSVIYPKQQVKMG